MWNVPTSSLHACGLGRAVVEPAMAFLILLVVGWVGGLLASFQRFLCIRKAGRIWAKAKHTPELESKSFNRPCQGEH